MNVWDGLFDGAKGVVSRFRNLISKTPGLSKEQRELLIKKLNYLSHQEVNLLIIGGTGVGKSSTINALFQTNGRKLGADEEAMVGKGPDPETKIISAYRLDNLIIWDSPGLGESIQKDMEYCRKINEKLRGKKGDEYLIDLVLVLLDGGSRDYDSTFRILQIIKQCIPKLDRVVVGINQIDMVEHGQGWDEANNCPTPKLQTSIEKKVASVKRRLRESSGLEAEPLAYSAGYENDWGSRKPYQIPELLCQIISAIPAEKRVAVLEQTKPEVIKNTNQAQRKVLRERTRESFGVGMAIRMGLSALTGGILGGCFITTAVCQYFGKADDCHMLRTFRFYRDHWLRMQSDGDAIIREYYTIAPEIVQWIETKDRRDAIYERLLYRYLRPCYSAIQRHRYEQAKLLYVTMVHELLDRKKEEEDV